MFTLYATTIVLFDRLEKENFTMTLFPDQTIKEYMDYKKANPNHFNWWSYINIKADLQTALAFAKFYYPEIVEEQGYFLLKDKYTEDLLEAWKTACRGDKNCVEKMMNMYELKDFFHINVNEQENEVIQTKMLGDVIKLFWSMSFKHQFPQRNIIVEIYEEHESLFITVYEH